MEIRRTAIVRDLTVSYPISFLVLGLRLRIVHGQLLSRRLSREIVMGGTGFAYLFSPLCVEVVLMIIAVRMRLRCIC